MYRKPLVFILLCLLFISGYSQQQYNVSTLAGDTSGISQGGVGINTGFADGAGGSALFNSPTGIAIDTAGNNLYIADTYNNVIRKVNISTGMVTTIAGDTTNLSLYSGTDSNLGYVNGNPFAAKFNTPWGVCVDDTGNVYVADTYNNVIRKIWASTGKVTTYAGRDSSGVTFQGYINGDVSVAEFYQPLSLTIDTSGNIYVTDNGNNAIREIWASTHLVTTIAGRGSDTAGYINGPIDTAEFYSLYGITLGHGGSVFVSQYANGYNAVRRLYHDTVTTYSGFDFVGFDTSALYYGSIPNGYQNGYQNGYGLDTNSLGDTIIVGGVLYNDPAGLAFDTSGDLLVVDEYNNVIRKVTTSDSLISTLAGNDSIGFRNGAYNTAEFYNPIGIVADKKGNLYVTDLGNNAIREITPQGVLGINTIKKPLTTVSAYPNPSNGIFTVAFSHPELVSGSQTTIDVYNIIGEQVYDGMLKQVQHDNTLDLSNQPSGVYLYRVITQDGNLVGEGKIIVQR